MSAAPAVTTPGASTPVSSGAAPALLPKVLDSSAMLAYSRNETGGTVVAALLADPQNIVYAHSVNLAEVFYAFGPPSVAANLATAERTMSALQTAGVIERADLDAAFWRDIALLIAERRAAPRDPAKPKAVPTLALGDAFGLALTRRLGGEFVTGDRSEIEPMEKAGFCRAVFIK